MREDIYILLLAASFILMAILTIIMIVKINKWSKKVTVQSAPYEV